MNIIIIFLIYIILLSLFGYLEYFFIKVFIIFKEEYEFRNIKNLKDLYIYEEKYIYRIEKNGIGPFNNIERENDKKLNELLLELYNKRTPSPLEDKLLRKKYLFLQYRDKKELKKHFYAFKSLEEFNFWFKPELKKLLKKYGYQLYKYKINKYIEGKTQIMFKKEDIIVKEKLNY